MKRLVRPLAVLVVVLFVWGLGWGASARADLKMTSRTTGRALGFDAEGETVIYLKGATMRSDYTAEGGKQFSTILDVENQRMISINHQKKSAEVFDLREIAGQLSAIAAEDVTIEMKATGERRTIAGLSCQRHELEIKVPFVVAESERVDAVVAGPAWIAKDAPGAQDYARFYLAAAERGLFFGPPAQAKAQPGQSKAMTEMYRQFAKAGLACASEMAVRFEGSGMMATIMGKMGSVASNSELVALSTDALGDDLFRVPAGYKTKQK